MIQKTRSTYNPVTLQTLINSVKNNIAIDNKLSLGTIYDLAARYHAFSPSSLQTWTLPTTGEMGTPAGDVELVATGSSNSYVDTIEQFLGTRPDPVTTPPLDAYGYPITVPSVTTTPATSSGSPTTTARARPVTTPPPASTTPSYEPSLC
jgi:hypothetical protein